MEFSFNCERLFNCDEDGIAVLSGKELSGYSGVSVAPKYGNRFTNPPANPRAAAMEQIGMIIDNMGEASSKAQKLPQTITTMGRFAGTNQRLYIKVSGSKVEGILKVGERTLFYRDYSGKCKEIEPLCVLDFYVHESIQRTGLGSRIFVKMLEHEGVMPNKLAYDRPSQKLLKFLEKNFELKHYVPQNNNYVIYEAYWRPGYSIPKKVLERNQPQKKPDPPQKDRNRHYFEVNEEDAERDRERDREREKEREMERRRHEQEELDREMMRREQEIQVIREREYEMEREMEYRKQQEREAHKKQQHYLPQVHPQLPNHSTGSNPGKLSSNSPSQPKIEKNPYAPNLTYQHPTHGPLNQQGYQTQNLYRDHYSDQNQLPQQQPPQAQQVSHYGNRYTTSNTKSNNPFNRELNSLDTQINKTEEEIKKIRENIESLQNNFNTKRLNYRTTSNVYGRHF